MSPTKDRSLRVETLELPTVLNVLNFLDEKHPLLWWKHNEGFTGVGAFHEIAVSGEERFSDSQAEWRELVSAALVTNSLTAPGTGLVAFGTFAFRALSKVSSKLIIPRHIIGYTANTSWVTRFSWQEENLAPFSQVEAQLLVKTPTTPAATSSAHFTSTSDDKKEFTELVNQAISHISAGEVEKVVISRELSTTVPEDFDLRPAVSKLSERYPECWTFCVDGFFGSSPETLITVESGSFTARVLAGTAPRGSSTQEDSAFSAQLASSTKDLDEHGFATRSVVHTLSPLVEQLSVSESPFTLKLPNLWHLATDIAGTLHEGATSLDVIAALHPTAAVAGTPTSEAVHLIDELEDFDRGRYAGPVGWVDANGDGQWAIALRCAQLEGNTIRAWAGCGIVADSQPEQEFNETNMKFRPITEALA